MTDRYAVIGNPVVHSKSPDIHAAFARAAGEEVQYDRPLSPIGSFFSIVGQFRLSGGKRLNLTVPFKQAAESLFVWRGVRPGTQAVLAAQCDSASRQRLQ